MLNLDGIILLYHLTPRFNPNVHSEYLFCDKAVSGFEPVNGFFVEWYLSAPLRASQHHAGISLQTVPHDQCGCC